MGRIVGQGVLLLMCIAAGLMLPAGCMDGQCKGLGFFDLPDEYVYKDLENLPTEAKGMPHEMRVLMKSAETYHRGTLVAPGLQDAEDRRLEERENKEKAQLIPRKIWQRCPSFPPPKVEKCYIKSWRDNNPDYEHSVIGDEDALRFVAQAYPALKKAYLSLRDRQAREDLFAYLIVFKHGGVFASLDTTCERSLADFIDPKDDFLAGLQPKIESRVLAKQVGLLHHTMPLQQFCFAAAPGHPILRFLIDYIVKNVDKRLCDENPLVDTLLRTGAGPFTDAVLAFKNNPEDGRQVRVATVGAFALGQVWGSGDTVTIPCAKKRHGYGFWFDDRGKKHMCDCPTRKEGLKLKRNQRESPCFVRRRYIEGAGVKSLVRLPELVRKRALRKWHT